MRISFPFLLSKYLCRLLLIMITSSFYSPLRRGYIHKVSVNLVQKKFLMIAVLFILLAANEKRNPMKEITKRDSIKT